MCSLIGETSETALLRKKNLNYHHLGLMYEELGTLKAIAERTGICTKTLKKYLGDAGITVRRGLPRGTRVSPKHRSCLANWLREHPGVPLPRKVQEIVEMTGCSANAIKTYLYRRRKEIRDYVKSVDFKQIKAVLHSIQGDPFPTRSIEYFETKVDPYSFHVYLDVRTYAGTQHRVELSLDEVKRIWESRSNG